MYHRILVPLDDTDHSRRALGEAIRIATDADARLRLLFVVEDVHPWDFHLSLHTRRIERADGSHVKKLLLAAVDLVRHKGLRVDGVMRFAEGQPVHSVIAREAEAAQIDLVVMGSRGGFSIGPFRFGSVAQKVAQYCRVPVMIMRRD